MKHLFVFGPLDGEWIKTDGQPYWQALKPVKRLSIVGDFKPVMTYEHERVAYRTHQFGAGEFRYLIYAPTDRTAADILSRLVDAYKVSK